MSKHGWISKTGAQLPVALLIGAAALGSYALLNAADHTDSPLAAADQAADLADLYSFQSGDNLVLALTISNAQAAPEIQLGRSIFDPEVLYQINIDNDGDAVADLVIQGFVTGNPRNQVMNLRGPVAPEVTGTSAKIVTGPATNVRVSTGVNPIIRNAGDITVFAGVRDDPFFFDLGQFNAIISGQAGSFNDPGTDSFAGLNVYAIVIELPISMLGDPSTMSVWASTYRL
ncbi:MAG: DUF4331 family protein [Gemmatimonadota bacterium]